MADDKLILDLIDRFAGMLPVNTAAAGETINTTEQRKQNEAGLIALSEFRVNLVANGIAVLIERCKAPDQPDGPLLLAKSQLILWTLLNKCLEHRWDCLIKQKVREAEAENEKMAAAAAGEGAEKLDKEESKGPVIDRSTLDPPPLDVELAQLLLQLTSSYILGPLPPHSEAELRKAAGLVLLYVSGANFDVVFTRIKTKLTNLIVQQSEEDMNNSDLYLINHLLLNGKRLSDLFQELSRNLKSFKRNAQMIISIVLRTAIWNWIDHYPMEFVALCQSGDKMRGNPDVLFDVFDALADNNKRKQMFWPLQTMLLILCPDLFMKVTLHEDEVKVSTKADFIANLAKSFKNVKLADVAAVSYVDMCKAATYVAKEDLSPLRYQIPTIERPLKEKLFDPKRDNKSIEVDLNLMVDCFVSLFRLNPAPAMRDLFGLHLGDESPHLFKLVFCKAYHRLAKEGNSKLPWNPTVDKAHQDYSAAVRTCFYTYQKKFLARDKNTKTKAKDAIIMTAVEVDVLKHLIELFRVDPMFFITNSSTDAQTVRKDVRSLFTALCSLLMDMEYDEIFQATVATLLELHQTKFIEKWCPQEVLNGFWDVNAAVNSTVSKMIFELKDITDAAVKKRAFDLLVMMLEIQQRRNIFLSSRPGTEENIADTVRHPTREKGTGDSEAAFLISLCSYDNSAAKAVEGIGLVCEESEILRSWLGTGQEEDVTSAGYAPNSFSTNLETYTTLAALSSQTQMGRELRQKEIRKLLRRVSMWSQGNVSAWEQVYERWQEQTELILRLNADDAETTAPDAGGRGLFGFISVLSGDSGGTTRTFSQKDSEALRAEWLNYTGFLAAQGGVMVTHLQGGSKSKFDSFLKLILTLMVCEAKYVRETILKVVAPAFSPVMYEDLFRNLHEEVSSYINVGGRVACSESATLFVEQCISLVRRILDATLDSADELALADYETLLPPVVQYVGALVNDEDTARIKIKLCALLELTMQKRQFITFRNEAAFRNRLVGSVCPWVSNYSDTKTASLKPETTMKVDITAMKAICAILEELTLEPSETETRNADGDAQKSKSDLFLKYFTFFTEQLNRCRRAKSGDASREGSLANLADLTIVALSNLLTANIDSGLEHFVHKGYAEDLETRHAFVKVLTNILRRGAEFDQLADTSPSERYEMLMELLLEDRLELAVATVASVPAAQADNTADLLNRVFTAGGRILDLLPIVIKREVDGTIDTGTLFRRNSIATKMLSAFSRQAGESYLHSVLSSPMKMIIDSDLSYEVDPDKISPGEDVKQNLQHLLKAARLLCDTIFASTVICPEPLRYICYRLASEVGAKFPEAGQTAVAGFIFLRFFCPAIVAPESAGLVSEPISSKEVRRGLVLITKIMQNLANRVAFGSKEAYMLVVNPFIQENLPHMRAFLDYFASPPTFDSVTLRGETELLDEDLVGVHRLIHSHLDNITKRLVEIQQTPEDGTPPASERLTKLIAQLGTPPEPVVKVQGKQSTSGMSHSSAGTNVHYQQFMDLNANTKTKAAEPIFYQHGKSKKGRPVFYYIARLFLQQEADKVMLIFHILKTLESFVSAPFDVVIDCAMFGPENHVEVSWIHQFLRVLPFGAVSNLSDAIVLYPNHSVKVYAKSSVGRLVSSAISKKLHFCSTVGALEEFIAAKDVKLPGSTMALQQDVKSTFNTELLKLGANKDAIIKITPDSVQVTTTKASTLFGRKVNYTDVVPMSRIEDIFTQSNDPNQFAIKYQWDGSKIMSFSSKSAEQIIHALKISQAGWRLTKADTSGTRRFRPEDVPGTLLNMALLNLGSDDFGLRMAAYELLYALAVAFNFSVKDELLQADCMFVPANTARFVVKVSSKLAVTEQRLTLEFLRECLESFNKETTARKNLCLHYMSSWLPNLEDIVRANLADDYDEKVRRVQDIINTLVDLTLREKEVYPATQQYVWAKVGRCEDLLPVVLDIFCTRAINAGLESTEMEVIADTTLTLAAHRPSLVAGRIISRIRKALRETALYPCARLETHAYFGKIAVLVRFLLLLSFHNHVDCANNIPEILHVVMSLVSTGPMAMRQNVHGLAINVVQSLCVSSLLASDQQQALRFHLRELAQLRYKLLFGVSQKDQKSTDGTTITRWMPIHSVESVATALFDILTCCQTSANTDADHVHKALEWMARWQSLTTQCAFEFNPALQPRAFVTLGVVALHVDDDLLSAVLDQLCQHLLLAFHLVSAPGKYSQPQNDFDCTIAIIICLTRFIAHLQADSKFIGQLFWIALGLLQISEMAIFPASLQFLEAVLRILDSRGFLQDSTLNAFLRDNRDRDPEIKKMLSNFDAISQLSFDTSPSFAIAGVLLKGLKHPSTKAATVRLLFTILDVVGTGGVDADILGYLAALAAAQMDVSQLRTRVSSTDPEPEGSSSELAFLFSRSLVTDTIHGVLLLSFLVTFLDSAEYESEQLFVYRVLREGVFKIPDCFAVTHKVLGKQMSQVLRTSQNPAIVDIVQEIMACMIEVQASKHGTEQKRAITVTYLKEIGFAGLPETATTMSQEKKVEAATVFGDYLKYIIQPNNKG